MGRNGNDVFVLGEESLTADDLPAREESRGDFLVGDSGEGDFSSFESRPAPTAPLQVGFRSVARRNLAALALGAGAVVLGLVLLNGGGGGSADSSPSPQAHAPAAVVQVSQPHDSAPLALSRSHPVAYQPVRPHSKQHKLRKRPRGGPEREPNSEPAPVGPPVDEPAPASVPLPVPATEPAPVSSPPDPSPPPTGGGGSVARPEFGFER